MMEEHDLTKEDRDSNIVLGQFEKESERDIMLLLFHQRFVPAGP